MKKLDKTQKTKHAELLDELTETRDVLKTAVAEYNAKVKAAHEEMQPKVEAFNEAVTNANEFVEEVHDEQQSYYDEKSENWQEGEAGSDYQSWMESWEIELEEIEIEDPPELDEPEIDIEPFEQLPAEVEG